MSNTPDFDDPFAEFDDLDGDGLNNSNSSAGFDDDELESTVASSLPDDDDFSLQGEEEDEQAETAPQKAKPSAAPAAAPAVGGKPFIKTPLGMAVVGSCVVVAGVVGLVGLGVVGGSHPAPNVIPEVVRAEVAPASEPAFDPAPVQAAQVAPTAERPLPKTLSQALEQQQVAQEVIVPAKAAPVQAADVASGDIAEQREVLSDISESLAGIRNEIKALNEKVDRNNAVSKDLAREVENLTKLVADSTKAPRSEQVVATNTAPQSVVDTKPVADVAPKVAAVVEKPAVVPSEHALAKGRDRVADFVIVDSSASGEMAIIKKASSGRVFTVFKGEVLNIGGQRLTVNGVVDNGAIVLVGDKLYIDKSLAEKAKPVAVAQTPTVAKASKPRASVANSDSGQPTVAKGFTLNAVYDSDNSFGVVDNKGEFKSYKVGQSIPELGGAKVIGLDAKGNLKVGNTLIKSVYE